MAWEGISVSRDGCIATVTLDRPDSRNAVDLEMWRGLAEIFTQLRASPDLRGVILTGAGDCFSSGADIGDFEETRATVAQGLGYEADVDRACDAIAGLGCPVIAVIRGYCYGGACHLAIASDFRFVDEAALFCIPAARLSIVYSARGMARLVALVGLAEAKRIFYSAQTFGAREAVASGFADRIEVDPLAAAMAWLRSIADLAPLSIAGAKTILNMVAMPGEPYDAALADAVTLRALASADYAEGRRAFAAKRSPQFRGA